MLLPLAFGADFGVLDRTTVSGRLLDQEFSSDRSVHRSKSIQLILDSAAHRPISARPEIPVSALGKGLGAELIPASIC